MASPFVRPRNFALTCPLYETPVHRSVSNANAIGLEQALHGGIVARVIVDVMLKPEILDPQGRAVLGALGRLGLTGVDDVRQGKQFVLTLEGEITDEKLAQIHQIAETLLSNPVIEDFTVRVEQ